MRNPVLFMNKENYKNRNYKIDIMRLFNTSRWNIQLNKLLIRLVVSSFTIY